MLKYLLELSKNPLYSNLISISQNPTNITITMYDGVAKIEFDFNTNTEELINWYIDCGDLEYW
jgi:hypothetical protein